MLIIKRKGVGANDRNIIGCGDNFINLMTFGDADNDLEMIKAAVQGIVMENGLPNVKAVATAITDTNDNDGVARYCERYFATLL